MRNAQFKRAADGRKTRSAETNLEGIQRSNFSFSVLFMFGINTNNCGFEGEESHHELHLPLNITSAGPPLPPQQLSTRDTED